jgi:putative oxidoreductase
MTSRSRLLRLILLGLRIALGGVFLYAAWAKLREPWSLFAISINAYHVLPDWAVVFVARTLPWFELLLGLSLIAGLWKRVSTAAASALLLVFFGLMVHAYAHGEAIDCGCFGPGEAISPLTLLRDGGLLAGAILLAITAWRGRSSAAAVGPIADPVLADANLGNAGNSPS